MHRNTKAKKKATESKKALPRIFTDDSYLYRGEIDLYSVILSPSTDERYLCYGNALGLRNTQIWKLPERRDLTYFILPAAVSSDKVRHFLRDGINWMDFSDFWSQVTFEHKERRLLCNHVSFIRDVMEPNPKLKGEDCFGILRGDNNLIHGFATDLLVAFRGVVEKSCFLSREEYATTYRQFYLAFMQMDDESFRFCHRAVFEEELMKMVEMFTNETHGLCSLFHNKLIETFVDFIRLMTAPIWVMYFEYLARGESDRAHYLKKLNAAVPHWRPKDRKYLFQLLANYDDWSLTTRDSSYAKLILDNYEPQTFKRLVFGREKFCFACRRSSYIGDEPLLCCRLCVKQRVRPKARYCNKQCQRAHWKKHRAAVHSNGEVPDGQKKSEKGRGGKNRR